MSKRAKAIVLALGLAAGWEGALAQESTELAPLTIVGQREPPVEMLPDINTCKAATDPYVAALRSATGGDGPRIYAQTRRPRNPDYNAPPLSPPGSPVPEVMSLRDYHEYAKRMRRSGATQYRQIARCLDSIYDASTSSLNALSSDSTASSHGSAGGT